MSSRLAGATVVAAAVVLASLTLPLAFGNVLATPYWICLVVGFLFLTASLVIAGLGAARALTLGECAQLSVREMRTSWVLQWMLVCVGLIFSAGAVVFTI